MKTVSLLIREQHVGEYGMTVAMKMYIKLNLPCDLCFFFNIAHMFNIFDLAFVSDRPLFICAGHKYYLRLCHNFNTGFYLRSYGKLFPFRTF